MGVNKDMLPVNYLCPNNYFSYQLNVMKSLGLTQALDYSDHPRLLLIAVDLKHWSPPPDLLC